MKKRFRCITAVLLAVVMVITMMMVGAVSVEAAYNYLFPVNNGGAIAYGYGYSASYGAWHNGIDIHSSGDDTIYAVCDGVVEATANSCYHDSCGYQCEHYNTYGNYIRIGNNDGMKAYYGHLKQNTLLVSVGQSVKRGQPIATMGSSGYSTGKHLHFELRASDYSTKINTNPTSSGGEMNYSTSGYGNPNTEISYSVNLNDGDAISGNSFPITGTVTYGGKYPWLHLYVDYGWVADTANNSLGNYAFYLDTTKFSDGQHLLGVKITNDEGLDYTTWRTIYIDNTKPVISSTYISEVTDYNYRVCCAVNDNIAVSKVRVATWTQPDRSDLIWHDCNYNGVGTYFYDCNKSDYALGATQYFNHIYAYDKANNYAFGEQIATFEKPYSLFKSTYYTEISESKFRVCCEMNNPNDIEKVRIATWATANQTDVIWHDCNYNGVGTYFYDINRSDYASGLNTYISHVYAYSKSGKCDVVEKRLTYENKPPIISDITISERSSKGFRISCKVEDDNSIKEVEFPTWLANNEQHDLIWYRAEIKDGIATCYIQISDHNNEYGVYYTHIYAYDIFNNLSTERVTVVLNEPKIGDLNGDNSVDILDATIVQKHAAGKADLTPEQIASADVNNDGVVDILDAAEIQKFAAGKITEFKKKA